MQLTLSNVTKLFEHPANLFFGIIIILLLAISSLPLGLSIFTISKVVKKYISATDISSVEELPAKFVPLIVSRINLMYLRMPVLYQQRLSRCSMRFFLERRNHSSTPCMIASHNTINLILPLGFFKIIKSNPNVADAMIAHELAHFFHEDYKWLLVVKSFMKAGAIFNIFVALNLLRSAFCFLVLLIPGLIYASSTVRYLHRTAERSEELADLFAALVVGPAHVKQFLNNTDDSYYRVLLLEEQPSWHEYLWKASLWVNHGADDSLHPPVKNRIKLLSHYEFYLPSN